MADVERASEATAASVTDDDVKREGRRTAWALVGLSALVAAFCLSMMAYFAAQLADVVGGSCPDYAPQTNCQTMKEMWCKVSQCPIGTGTIYDSTNYDSQNSCPQGCSVCTDNSGGGGQQSTGADPVDAWKDRLKRLDACAANTKKVRECLPMTDTDGSLANYRGPKVAHSGLNIAGSTAFLQTDAWLDACDAQATYADRRERGGSAVLAMLCFALVLWILTILYTLRVPNYKKYPRKTDMKPLNTFSEKKSFNNRYHPDSVWMWYSSVMALIGFAVQLYSFYTPTTTDIRIPIAQGVWITLEIVSRGVLMLLDKFTLLEASSIFFDMGFSIVGFLALLEPFFEPKITTKLPEVDESVTDYALAIRVIAFVFPLCMSTLKVRDLYIDNYWPSPATAKAMAEKKRSLKRTIIKLVLLGVQLGAAMSVYGIMGDKDLCHTFRTCARPASCTPNIPVGATLDHDLMNGNAHDFKQELISNDANYAGKMKWRWQAQVNTNLYFTKVGSTLYADMKITAQSTNRGENNVKNPGTDVPTRDSPLTEFTGNPATGVDVQPSETLSSCGTRFEVRCQEVNPRHAFEELTGAYEWVDYNKSMYKFVAKYDYQATSGSPSCWGESSSWGPNNAQFVADASFTVGGTSANPEVGYVFMEQTCACGQASCVTGNTTKFCLVEPPFVAVYKPYGRSVVKKDPTWSWAASNRLAMPDTWATSLRTFIFSMHEVGIPGTSAPGPPPGTPGGGCPNPVTQSSFDAARNCCPACPAATTECPNPVCTCTGAICPANNNNNNNNNPVNPNPVNPNPVNPNPVNPNPVNPNPVNNG